MKRLDSYRLLDLLLMVLCTGLGIIFPFLISLGYNEISKYFVEIIDFPYFVAFLPSSSASSSVPPSIVPSTSPPVPALEHSLRRQIGFQ